MQPTATPPVIDGVIDDPAWTSAAHSDALRQVLPQEDVAPTERTEFWVTFDADNLYVAIRCHDSGGLAGIRAYSMQRDQDNGSDDLVRIVFDPFNRRNDGYYFALTAAGGRHDGLIQNKEQANDQWDAIWQGRVTRDESGWSAEFAIPAKSLSFNPANDTWGFNVARGLRRKQEVMRWSGFLRNRSTAALPLLGELTGVTGLQQGRGIDLKPSLSLTRRSAPAPGDRTLDFRPSLDLVWHVTPSLAATFTANTDFADAEVDERRVNLGRFPLFYPEKRGFFLQDAPLFTFAGIRRDPLPFFSRRIGLAADGSKVDVLGGLKLTGRTGPLSLGLLGVRIDEHQGVAARHLVAGRAALNVLEESTTGVIFTHGDPRGNGANHLVGADFNYVNNRFRGGKSLSVRAAALFTDSDLAGGPGSATTLSVDYPNEPLELFWFFRRVDDRYDPALGFVSRTGVQAAHLWNRWRWFPERVGLRRLDGFVEGNLVTDLGGRRLDHDLWLGLEGETPAGDFFTGQYVRSGERLDAPFAIQPGIVIPAGDHRWDRVRLHYGTTISRPANVQVEFETGTFFTGHRTNYEIELGWRPSNRLEFATEFEWHVIRLPQGNFTLRESSARVVYTFTPDLQLSLLAQYDSISAELGVNFRAKWTPRPGNDFFFIVNQGYDTSLARFRPTENETSVKGAWTFRF